MKTGLSILAGLLAGILVAVGILAAFVFVGPDPVGLRPTPPPTLAPAAPSPAPSVAASPSVAAASPSSPGPSPAGSAGGSLAPGAAVVIGQPPPALVVPQLGGGTIDLASLEGKAVWLTFMQTTCPACVDAFPLMNGFAARYAGDGLVVIAVDSDEAESIVTAFVQQRKSTFPVGLDLEGTARQAWGLSTLPAHVWIDTVGIVRDAAAGRLDDDTMAVALRKILPGVNVTP